MPTKRTRKYLVCRDCGKRDEPSKGNPGTAALMLCKDCGDLNDGFADRCRECCPTGHGTHPEGER